MIPRKKIKSLQDLYPTPQKKYGLDTRHSENFGINLPLVTLLASLPPLMISAVSVLNARTTFTSKTDIANHSILFIIAYILAGLFVILSLLKLRSILRRDVTNLGFLSLLYALAFFPACLVVVNIIVTAGVAVSGIHQYAVAAISVVVIMFLFALSAIVTNR